MIPILLILSSSNENYNFGDIIDINEYLSQEAAPSFQELPTDDDEFKLEGKIEVSRALAASNGSKRYNEFYMSSLSMGAVTIQSCYAFGAGAAAGSGGAVFLSYSSLTATGGTFKLNTASVGGALCSLCSAVSMNACPKFTTNTAYKYGGAIYFQGVFEKKDENKLYYSLAAILNIKDSQIDPTPKFDGNKAGEIGGGIAFSLAATCGIEKVKFNNNQAGHSGGAICAMNAPLSIIGCFFVQNKACLSSVRGTNSDKKPLLYNKIPRFLVKGGGAISFVADKYQAGYNNDEITDPTRMLYTDGCCFSANSAGDKVAVSFNNGPGHEIMLGGYTTWYSSGDSIAGGYKEGTSVAVGKNTDQTNHKREPQIWIFSIKDAKTTGCDGSPATGTQMTVSYSKAGQSTSGISYVASPTNFVYQQTPLTELPYATTKSWTKYTPAQLTSAPEARTVKATLHPTRTRTLFPTRTRTLFPTVTRTLFPTITRTFFPTRTRTLFPTVTRTLFPTRTRTLLPTATLNPTNAGTPSLSETLIDTLMYTPRISETFADTFAPTFTRTFFPSPTLEEGKKITQSLSYSISKESILTSISKYTSGSDGKSTIFYYTAYTEYIHKISTYVDVIIDVNADDGENEGDGLSPSLIITIAIIGALVLLCVAIVAVFIYRKSTNGSSEDIESISTDELFDNDNIPQYIPFPEEEEILSPFDNTQQNNPITTTDIGDEDEVFDDDNYIDQLNF